MLKHAKGHRTPAVAYLIGYDNYTWVHYSDGSKVLVTKTLCEVMEPHFIRISRKMGVNPAFIRKSSYTMNKWHQWQLELKMKDGSLLPVSRRRVESVRLLLEL